MERQCMIFTHVTDQLCIVGSSLYASGADPGFDQGGPQIVTGLKLPVWGLSFVEFWCWGLIFGGQGGPGPPAPPDPPLMHIYYGLFYHCLVSLHQNEN